MLAMRWWLVFVGCVALTGVFETRGLEARVRATDGVPRIEIDGEPIRGRIFFGNPGQGALAVGKEPSRYSFVFTAHQDSAGRGTLHFRFGASPGHCWLDDVLIEEADTGRAILGPCTFEEGQTDFDTNWDYWPKGVDNTVAGIGVAEVGEGRALRVRLARPAKGKWPDFHIYTRPTLDLTGGKRYRVSFRGWADTDRKWTLGCYVPGTPFVALMHVPGAFESQIRLAADVGVNVVSFSLPMPWPKPGEKLDWRPTDRRCSIVLAANPNALLLPRIGMEPPAWWKKAWPDHVMHWEDGPRRRGVAVASQVYRVEAAARLRAVIEHLEAMYPERMAGYHPAGHNTGEWFYQDTWQGQFDGYSPVTKAAWRDWLRRRYGTVLALRAAWGNPGATFAAATVPSPERRRAAPAGVLRDPATERDIMDFDLFRQEAMADCVCALARAVRSASRGRKLSVLFFGYVFEFAAIGRGPGASGHYGLRRVLDCPDIDILCSPISYVDRGLGQSAPSMTATESVALAGKLWLNEDDTATYLSSGTFPGHRQKVATLADTNSQLLRNVGQAACRNLATWWMDLGATGWFDDPGMWAEMKRLEAIDLPLLKHPAPFRPEVALVNDARSMCRVATGGASVTRPLIYESRGAAARMGAAFGQYLLDDVLSGRVDAKLFVFLNAWTLTAGERSVLHKRLRGKTALWCYAPGYHDGDTVSLAAMRQLTGQELVPFAAPQLPRATPTEAGLAAGLEPGAFGGDKPVRPLFHVPGTPADRTLARYPNGEAAVTWAGIDGGGSIFCGAPRLTPGLLRFAAKRAGVHLWTEDGCVLYTHGPFIVLHGTGPDPVQFDTGTTATVIDALTGKTLGRGPKLTIPLGFGQTRILRMIQ